MRKRYYIAYGSNLSTEQMAFRTPDAKIVGRAILYGWQLLFKVHATIEENPKMNTPVLVWEISEQDEKSLDRYEGYPAYYYKRELPVEVFPMDGGEPVQLTAMVYIMVDGHELREPTPDYYRVLAQGYHDFHFPMHILEQALRESRKKIRVTCYGRKEEWDSRKVAMAFYKRAMACSEGSEQGRYTRIYLQLAAGKIECTDEEGYNEDSH